MPNVIIGAFLSATISAVGASFAVGATTAAIFSAFIKSFATSFVLGAISNALQERAEDIGITSRNQNVIQPITYRTVVYGQVRVAGPKIFMDTTDGNSRLHVIIPLAGHEVEEIGDIFINGEHVPLNASGFAIGKYATFVRIKKHLGTSSQAADPDLVAESPFWTTAHQGLDVAYLYCRFLFNVRRFPSIPDVTAIVKGKKIFDTRDLGTRWTRNAALIRRDYLTNTYYGMGVPTSFINDASVTEAANIDDELVDVKQESDDFVADAGTDICTRSTLNALWLAGDVVQLTTTDTLPAGLSPATDYYIILGQFKVIPGGTDTTFLLATSLANALAGTAIDITDTGTGTHTVTRMQEVRYTIDGHFGMNSPHETVLKQMNTACYGKLIYSGGTWFVHSGAFRSPTVSIDEDDLRGPIQIQTLLSKQELANGVTGIFINPYDDWQPSEFPSVISSTFVAEDGETINRDVRLPMSVSTSAVQRIAKIDLLRTRQQMSIILPCKLSVLNTKAGDTIQLTHDRFGFSLKEFEVIEWKFNFDETDDGLVLGIDLTGRETSSTDYDFLTSEEQVIDPAPNTNLPDPFTVIDPTGLTLSSGSAQLYLRLDGTVMSRIRVDWTAPVDSFVTDSGKIEIQFKRSSDSEWQKAPNIRGDEVFTFIFDVEDGIAYDVRIQSVNHFRNKNDTWVTETNHTVVGKTAVPANVTVFSAQQNRDVVTFKWGQIADVDLSGYEIRFAKRGSFVWATAGEVTEVTKGTLITNTALPPGDWTVGIKAVDTSGNESATEKTFDIVVGSSLDIVVAQTEHPRWLGDLVSGNFVRHDVSGRLVPNSNSLADAAGFEIFDQFVYDPVATAIYESVEIDLGFDADNLRVWSDTLEALGPGETGIAATSFTLDYRDDAASYDGFEPWNIGFLDARFILGRITMDTSVGLGYVEEFTLTVDIEERSERGENVTIAVAGTTINFAEAFHSIPNVQATVSAGSGLFVIVSSITTTSFLATVFNSSGTDVGGSINWLATGV